MQYIILRQKCGRDKSSDDVRRKVLDGLFDYYKRHGGVKVLR